MLSLCSIFVMSSCLTNYSSGRVNCASNAIASFPALQNGACAHIHPYALVTPTTEAEVSYAVRYASARGMPLSYVGGGHAYTCKSVIRGSLQISMRNFKSINVQRDDDGGGTVTMGTGVLFSEVFEHISTKQNAIAHGGCHSVGVAGFYLHGGIHAPATRLTGVGNATVEAMRVITADGLVHALTREVDGVAGAPRNDLWRAMLVAGSSFGIATSLTVRFLAEPEASMYVFLVRMDEEQFTNTLISGIDRVREDGTDAFVTLDGAGPVRFTPFTTKKLDPSLYIFQVSVRNTWQWVPQFTRQLAASAYLLAQLPPVTWPSFTTLPQTIEDLSVAYDVTGSAFTSTFMCFEESHCDLRPIVRRLTDHYRSYAYADTAENCWQVFSTLTSFPDKVCFEYNCPDRAVFHRELEWIDDMNKRDCPSFVRYYNVPSFWAPHGQDYFTNYDQLVAWKIKWDPNRTLNALSGT